LARTLRQECALQRGARILVAVSGGGDSQSLIHALATVAPRRGWSLVAHGVDHGLRPEARGELDLAEELAASLGVAFARSNLSVRPGANLMHRARRARYAALRAAAQEHGAAFIATAHHADDRAETVLLRLLRGAGPRGLGVLPAQAGDLLRPLIRVRRREVQAHLARHRLAFAHDPSNDDRRFLRVRVRHELMPVLESLSPEVVSHLNALADQLAAEPLPAIVDAAGSIVELGRAHADAVRELLRTGSRQARVRLPGDRVVRLDSRGIAVVESAPGLRGRGRGAKHQKND
jgi:tRNA(Ile)-lysidine synthase